MSSSPPPKNSQETTQADRNAGSSEEVEQPRLYRDLARLWPLLSPAEDYVEEADTLLAAVDEYSGTSKDADRRPTLLELGAGGGHVLAHLEEHFECTATDLSGAMLEECSKLVPSARRIEADMRTLRLEESFDVVLLLDAVDYMNTEADLIAALRTAQHHLAPGGVVLVAPTYTRESFVDGDVADDGAVTDTEELTYFSYVHDPDPTDTQYELILIYLLRDRATRRVEVIEDRHRCGFFREDEWGHCFEAAGLVAHRLEDEKAWTLFAATVG